VIHDRNDRLVPWHKGASFARGWPGARFFSTRGLGHRRILQDERVTSLAAEFIAGHSVVAGPAVPALPHPAPLY
jgi:hypothetical protein